MDPFPFEDWHTLAMHFAAVFLTCCLAPGSAPICSTKASSSWHLLTVRSEARLEKKACRGSARVP